MSMAAPKQTLPAVGGVPEGTSGTVPFLAEPGSF